MQTFKREGKLKNRRYVSRIEISRLINDGPQTIQSLENLTGSNSIRTKLASMVNKKEGIVGVKSTVLGLNNQLIFTTKGANINFEGLLENIACSLGVYYLREALGLKVTRITPVWDSESYTAFRGFIALGESEDGMNHYMDLRFSVYNEMVLDIKKFKTKDDKSTNVIIFPDAVIFNTFRNEIKNIDEMKKQIWIILNGTDTMILAKGTEAKIITNMQPIGNRDEFIKVVSGFDNVQHTREKFFSIVQEEYDKAERNSERFLKTMAEGKIRASEKTEG